MPHSPAEKGPLKEPISFAYIVDDLRSNMSRMGAEARRGASDTRAAFGAGGGIAATLTGAAGRGSGATQYVMVTLSSGEMVELLRRVERGESAANAISPRGRETSLGMARGQ